MAVALTIRPATCDNAICKFLKKKPMNSYSFIGSFTSLQVKLYYDIRLHQTMDYK